ncbi:MAG: hypothetical protein SFV23_01285 [Planctomycetaceae bacterium]|nr:hypothetical protein [Planctomycetaceae bacterium]
MQYTQDGPAWPTKSDHPDRSPGDKRWTARARERFLRRAKRYFLQALLQHGIVSIDAVREAVPVPDGVNPKCCGQIPTDFHSDGIIERLTHVRTERPVAHSRHIGLWRLTKPASAMEWLATHPDLPADNDFPASLAPVPHRPSGGDRQGRLVFDSADFEGVAN